MKKLKPWMQALLSQAIAMVIMALLMWLVLLGMLVMHGLLVDWFPKLEEMIMIAFVVFWCGAFFRALAYIGRVEDRVMAKDSSFMNSLEKEEEK